MTRTRYYVGLETRDGQTVSEATQDKLCQLVADCYGGCTVYQAIGYWRGACEPSMVIEALGDLDGTTPNTLASWLANIANQSSVLWTRERVEGWFSS